MSYRDTGASEAAKQNIVGQTYQKYQTDAAGPGASALDEISDVIRKIDDGIMDRVARLESVANRVLGHFPEEASDKVGPSAIPNGDLERIQQFLSSVEKAVFRLGAVVARLERL